MEGRSERPQGIYSLEEISERYNILLVDTSALISPLALGENRKALKIGEKIKVSETKSEAALPLMEFIENGGSFYVTFLILEEYTPPILSYHSERKLKSNELGEITREFIESRGLEIEIRNELAKMIEDRGRTLKLDEDEWVLYKKFERLFRKIGINYKISDNDLDFLVSGAVVSQTRDSCALMSNDFGILRTWNYFLRYTGIDYNKLGFFFKR